MSTGNERSAQRACNLVDGAIYGSYHLDSGRKLGSVVEADELEIYETAGHKGSLGRRRADARAPRKRALKARRRRSCELTELGQRIIAHTLMG